MFSCVCTDMRGESHVIRHEDRECFLQAFIITISEKLYGLRVLVESQVVSDRVELVMRPAGAITFERRRAWARMRDEVFGRGCVVAGLWLRPRDIVSAWEKWPRLAMTARQL